MTPQLITDNDTLLAFVPNSITAVRGETPLYERIFPDLVAAELWAEANFFSADSFEAVCARSAGDDLRQAAAHLVATEALRRAVPALDVVFTPNGFAVTQTANLAPASKQRVDRLIGSLLAGEGCTAQRTEAAEGRLEHCESSIFEPLS